MAVTDQNPCRSTGRDLANKYGSQFVHDQEFATESKTLLYEFNNGLQKWWAKYHILEFTIHDLPLI